MLMSGLFHSHVILGKRKEYSERNVSKTNWLKSPCWKTMWLRFGYYSNSLTEDVTVTILKVSDQETKMFFTLRFDLN